MIRLLIALLALPALLSAQPLRWTTYTSTSNVADMAVASGDVWTVSSGGLSGYDPQSGLFDVYTNTRGLAMNNTQAVGRDARGWVWAAHQNGAITRINPATGGTRVIDDLRREVFEFTSILDVGDEVFVSANNGIYRLYFSAVSDNYRILEAIRGLGQFPGEARIADVAATHGYLYAATLFGLARVWLEYPTLSAPGRWETFTTAQGLPENDLRALFAASDGTLWIASAGRIVRFDGSAFTQVSATGGVVAFAEWEGAVYAATAGSVLRIDGFDLVPVGQGMPNIRDLAVAPIADGARLAAGLGDSHEARGGISFFDGNSWTPAVRATGIGSNLISALGIDPQGGVWGGGQFSTGIFSIRGESITNYLDSPQYPQPFFDSPVNSFAFDGNGGMWAGSEGGGVLWMRGDEMINFHVNDPAGHDATGPRLAWTAFIPNYLVASVFPAPGGDIYILNRAAASNLPLIRVPMSWIVRGNNPDRWVYHTPEPRFWDEPHTDLVEAVTDPYGRLWLGGHERNGVRNWVLDDRGSPYDTVGDQWFGYVPSQRQDPTTCFDELLTGVTSWDIDSQGYIWVGAHNGAYYSQGGIPGNLSSLRFVCVYDLPVGQSVNAVHVDGDDNKWFGTDDGVAVMDKNFTWVHVFKTADAPDNRSGLASNSITAITSDPRTGDVWIGTTDGLSRLQSPYVVRGEGLKDLIAYPNPFAADGSHRMFINSERLGGVFDMLRIYTLSGRLVREIAWRDAINPSIGWDGRNDEKQLVAGGVYVLIVSANDGNSATGKVAVLGK